MVTSKIKENLTPKISVFCESYEIEESPIEKSTTSGESTSNKVILKGKALVFNRPTRNKVMYTKESAYNTLPTWIGRPFLNSHDDSDVLNSIGHVTKMEIYKDEQGRDAMFYEADIDPEERDFIRKAKRKDIPHVSIQVLVSDVRRKESVGFGDYIEADIKEGLELSAVLIPGDWESNGVITEQHFAESYLGGRMKEFISKGRSCDKCGASLKDEDYDKAGSWSYTCPKCDFRYMHGLTDLSKEELNDDIQEEKEKEKKEPMNKPNFRGGVPKASFEEGLEDSECELCGREFDATQNQRYYPFCSKKCEDEAKAKDEAKSKEDLTTGNGVALTQVPALPTKKKIKTEPTNKVTPDLVPPTVISKASKEKIDDVLKKKTNAPDDTQEEQEAEFTYDKTIKYYKKGGNNIPAPYPKGFKAESLAWWKCCSKPMIVGKNSIGKTSTFCTRCGKSITVNEGIWKETYKNLNTKYEFLKTSKILTRRRC